MASMIETVPAGQAGGDMATATEMPRVGWTAPRVRRLATSSAEASTGFGPDAETIS